MKLQPIKRKPILHIDETPDDGYVLRILRTYRHNAELLWSISGEGASKDAKELCLTVNDAQKKRAALLDAAIRKLQG